MNSDAAVLDTRWFNASPGHMVMLTLIIVVGVLIFYYSDQVRRARQLFIRRIPGIDASRARSSSRCTLPVRRRSAAESNFARASTTRA